MGCWCAGQRFLPANATPPVVAQTTTLLPIALLRSRTEPETGGGFVIEFVARTRYPVFVAAATSRTTPLFGRHQQLGARMVPYAGWSMPIQYAGVSSEHQAVRTGVGVFDVSHMGQLHVRGEGAVAAVNRVITNDLGKAVDGRGIYTCCCNEQGTILDDLIVYRLATDHVLVVCNAANRPKIVEHFTAEIALPVTLDDDSSLLAVQGPAAAALLARLFGRDVYATVAPFRTALLQTAPLGSGLPG